MDEHVLEMRGICKSFPGVKALDHVDLSLKKGEVLALVGENGAGKSTLMKILSGAYRQDEGSVILKGEDLGQYSPAQAIEKGISVIYQELNDLMTISVAENIFIGKLPVNKLGIVNYNKLKKLSYEAQKLVGLESINPSEKMGHLRVAQKQLAEIARSFVREADIIVMDEPTASLTDKEIEKLYQIIKAFVAKGGSVILITHKLDEVFRIADTVMVLRDGRNVSKYKVSETTKGSMISDMVGRELKDLYSIGEHEIGDILFEAENISTNLLHEISFYVRSGEILGLYGLMGAGCENVTQCLYGVEKSISGTYRLRGKALNLSNPSASLGSGIAFVPSERKSDGLLLNQSIKNNITLSTLRKIVIRGILNFKEEEEIADKWIEALHIKAPGSFTQAASLSGGNQQKVVFSKVMNTAPQILILNEPTRGVDVGAKAEIYKLMAEFCSQGVGIIMVSTEMAETMAVADRVIVLHEGRITAEFKKSEYSQIDLIRAAIGE